MPQAYDSAVWCSLAVVLAFVLAVALTAVGQLSLERRTRRRPYWHAGTLAAALAGLFTAGMGASSGVVGAAVTGAVLGAWLVRRRNLARRPHLVALVGASMGFVVMSGGFARYLSVAAQADVERVELYVATFIGALIFATSAVALGKLRGALSLRAVACPGHGVVNVFALLLCGWLGYGFVTEQAQPFGFAALLAMSALACAMAVHVTLSREYAAGHEQDHGAGALAFAARGHGPMAGNLHVPDKRGLLTQIEWRGGEEQAWILRDMAQIEVRTAACPHRLNASHSVNAKDRRRACARRRPARATTQRAP